MFRKVSSISPSCASMAFASQPIKTISSSSSSSSSPSPSSSSSSLLSSNLFPVSPSFSAAAAAVTTTAAAFSSPSPNRLHRYVQQINQWHCPLRCKQFALTQLFNSQIPFGILTGIQVLQLTDQTAHFQLKNRRRIRNHLKSIHACAMAMLAESTAGALVTLHVPETHFLVAKAMDIQYQERCQGDLQAQVTITPEQVAPMYETDHGTLHLDVHVTDSRGKIPMLCHLVWAWKKKRKETREGPGIGHKS